MDLKTKHLPFFYYREEILSKISNLEINLCYLSDLKKITQYHELSGMVRWRDAQLNLVQCSTIRCGRSLWSQENTAVMSVSNSAETLYLVERK